MKLLAETFFGTINPPPALEPYGESGGLIIFASNIIRLLIIAGGLIAVFNIIQAGFQFITQQGDPKTTENALRSLTMSVMGLALMVLAPAIAAIIGFVFFNDAMFILHPALTPPGVG